MSVSYEDCYDQLSVWRRYLHAHPEVSGEEKHTSAYIAAELRKMGYRVQEHVFGYGLIADLPGDAGKKTVALRADMDALPIEEATGAPYASQNAGVMHACGHDAHVAMLLGAALLLRRHKPAGTVRFIFQPSEEKKPGGACGMIAAGAMEGVDAVFATHVTNIFPVGTIAVNRAVAMANSDDFDLLIRGHSGHGAAPHTAVDPILVAAEAVVALQTLPSRIIDPQDPLVVSVGSIHGGSAHNIIPEEVVMTGTLRCLDLAVRDAAVAAMHGILHGVTSSWGAEYRLDYKYGYKPVVNDPGLQKDVKSALSHIKRLVYITPDRPMLAGEDFAFYLDKVPGVFFFTGTGGLDCNRRWHNNRFDIREEALPIGTEALVRIAFKIANQDK